MDFSSILATLNEAAKADGYVDRAEDDVDEAIDLITGHCPGCAAIGIKRRAQFGIKGGIPEFCSEHAAPHMEDLAHKICEHEGCKTQAAYNFPSENKRRFCGKHKLQGMWAIGGKHCLVEGCITTPTFGIPGTKTPTHCIKHKSPDMKNIKDKKCVFEGGCDIVPTFGESGTKTALYCAKHKKEGMKNLKIKQCNYPGCEIAPSYKLSGTKKVTHCSKHKTEGMVSTKQKCKFVGGCSKVPSCNFPGLKPEYCAKHKIEGMQNIIVRRCKLCNKIPNYGYPGTIDGIYCKTHMIDGMVDVKHSKCDECKIRSSYGFPLSKLTKCVTHKLTGMTRYPNQKCLHVAFECKELAIYGFGTPMHCELHKLENEVNHIEKNCSKCGLLMILNQENLCGYCCDFTHKNIRLAKQKAIKEFFDANELKYDSYDKALNIDCGLERPDFVFDRGTFVIIVEVDENQHGSYPEACECQRMVNIHQSFGGLKVVFIRYNPDKYKGDQSTDYQKKQYLLNWINWITANPPAHHLSFVKLFFDGFTVAEAKLIEIPVI